MSVVSVGITGREAVFPLGESESLTIIHDVVSQGIRAVSRRALGERERLQMDQGGSEQMMSLLDRFGFPNAIKETCSYLPLSI